MGGITCRLGIGRPREQRRLASVEVARVGQQIPAQDLSVAEQLLIALQRNERPENPGREANLERLRQRIDEILSSGTSLAPARKNQVTHFEREEAEHLAGGP